MKQFARGRLPFVIVFSTLALSAFSQKPPVAPVREVTDDYFGVKLIDPYHWMEDKKSTELATWMKGQSDFTRAYLDELPTRAEILKRIEGLSDAGVRINSVQRAGGMYFYLRIAPGENNRKLYVRDGLNGTERLLLDPEKLTVGDKHFSIDSYSPTPDGRLVAYTVSEGGSEMGELKVLETATGRDMGERIDRVRFGAGSWLPDGKGLLYNRLQKLEAGAPATELYQKSRVYLHVLGTDPSADRAVFGYGVNDKIPMETTPLPFAFVPVASKYVIALVNSGVSPNSEYYFAPLSSIGDATIPWRRIAALEDEVSSFDIHGDDVYLTVYKNTPRYKVVRLSLSDPDIKKAVTVFPASEAVVTNVATAKDAYYVQALDGGVSRLWRVDYKTNAAEPIKLPYAGSAFLAFTDQATDGALFTVNSWTHSPALFAYSSSSRTATDTKLLPPANIDMSTIEIESVKVRSFDGTMVPLVILHKKGLKRDGTNPTLLDGYGAYGIENTSPFYYPQMLAWFERGGIFAVAGVRGGGEYGEEWHLAGKGPTKPNTWKDFIATAEYLVNEKYTSPAHLAGEGGSAGGILIGNAIATRPDLFRAAVDAVGDNNALRAETTSNGVPNIPEFGSTKTEEGFKALYEMDAYTKVKPGVKYPAVLLATGINDPRVEPWMSAKMAAKLQASTSSGYPILLRVDYDAGHGIGSTKKQQNELLADQMAFLLDQLSGKP